MANQAEIDRIKREYAERNREIDRQHRKEMAKIIGGGLLQGASFHPVFNIPYVGTGLGGAMFEAGNAIMQGKSGKDILKDAGQGFVVGETVGAIPYAGKLASKTKVGQAVSKGAGELAQKLAETPAVQKAVNVLKSDITGIKPQQIQKVATVVPPKKPKTLADIILEEAKDVDDYDRIFREEVVSNVGDIAGMIGRNSDSNINYSAIRDKLNEGGNYYIKTKINPRILDVQDRDLVQKDNFIRIMALKEETPPIVVGKDNFVIDGRHRTLQAIQDGLNEIDAYVTPRQYYELQMKR